MDEKIKAIGVGKWFIGYQHSTAKTLLMFEFLDREPINLLIPKDTALAIGRAILAQYENPPPKQDRAN
jgi:hypothetical protein